MISKHKLETVVNYFLIEFLKAFYYLHKNFKNNSKEDVKSIFLHRDFKPENIFLKKSEN
jgi:serine/threonine protein kinase